MLEPTVSCGVWSRPVVGGDGLLVGVDGAGWGEPRLSVRAYVDFPVEWCSKVWW